MEWFKTKALAAWQWLSTHSAVWFTVFILVYALAWTLNAVMQTKFVLKEWEELGKYILGKYGTDSIFNTPIPGVKKGEQA